MHLAPVLDAFALGEEMASHLGISVERSKLAIVGAAALLVAAAVSISGLVGFVGLVAPHVCRIVLGPRHRMLVPAAGLAGAIFVVVADLLARTLAAPSEIPLGVVTALVGGPFFSGCCVTPEGSMDGKRLGVSRKIYANRPPAISSRRLLFL